MIRRSKDQRGIVLLVTLMVLVVLLAAAVSIVRNTSLGQGIAGNLGFKKNATLAGDQGAEAARNWLQIQAPVTLEGDLPLQAYSSAWGTVLDDPAAFNWAASIQSTADDGNGNQVNYLIHRMCRFTGPTEGIVAGVAQECVYTTSPGSDKQLGSQASLLPPATIKPFYRVTSRVVGPRNTVSYVQTMLF